MPLYDYDCDGCGPFETRASMRDYQQPMACPSCGKESPRMIALPNVPRTSGATRLAHQLNERSADSPRVARREPAEPGHGARAEHHHHRHAHSPLPPQAARLGKGLRQSSRRWMIGH